MSNLQLLKELRRKTGLPFSKIQLLMQKESNPEKLPTLIEHTIKSEIESLTQALEIDIACAEKLYYECNCSLDRAIREGFDRKKNISFQKQKANIKMRLDRGWELIGAYDRNEPDDYRWLRVKKLDMGYLVEFFKFSKEDIEKDLDLLYSDAIEYKEINIEDFDELMELVEANSGLKNFDTVSAYDRFPL
jgi:hypothetical protein